MLQACSSPWISLSAPTRLLVVAAALLASAGARGAAQSTASVRGQDPVASLALAGADIRVRPAQLRPGELFEVTVACAQPCEGAMQLGDTNFSLYALGERGLRGYGAIPVEAQAGLAPLKVQVRPTARTPLEGRLSLRIAERAFEQSTLTVGKRFTQPSRAHQAQMREDRAAFARAYDVPFGPPLFDSGFASPRPGAKYTSRFGVARVFNGKLQSRHMGVDLDGKVGEPVRAANDGVVRMVRACFAAGNSVVLSHGAGLFTSYFHLSKFSVREGQKVRKGDVVGLLGATGRVTGPHLHFSAKLGEVTPDPEGLLAFGFFEASDAPEAKDAPATAQPAVHKAPL